MAFIIFQHYAAQNCTENVLTFKKTGTTATTVLTVGLTYIIKITTSHKFEIHRILI